MLVSCTMISAFADGGVRLKITDAEGAPGEEVTVSVECTENSGMSSCQVKIEYDSDAMELVKANVDGFKTEDISVTPNDIPSNPFVVLWDSGTTTIDKTGTMAELTFKIKDTTAEGDYLVKFADGSKAYDADVQKMTIELSPGKITVKEKAPSEPESKPEESKPESKPESTVESKPESKPESTVESKPESKPESTVESSKPESSEVTSSKVTSSATTSSTKTTSSVKTASTKTTSSKAASAAAANTSAASSSSRSSSTGSTATSPKTGAVSPFFGTLIIFAISAAAVVGFSRRKESE